MAGADAKLYRLTEQLARMDLPEQGDPVYDANTMLIAFANGCNPRGQYYASGGLLGRQFVYDRDGRKCLHCGTSEALSLDHIHPYSLGGSDEAANLQTLCRPCNSRKGAKV